MSKCVGGSELVTKPNLVTRTKWLVYRSVQFIAEIRHALVSGRVAKSYGVDEKVLDGEGGSPGAECSLCVFAYTLGELNAIEPLLRRMLAAMGDVQLVLITEHAEYYESYRSKYPGAKVFVSRSTAKDIRRVLDCILPPRLAVVAEVPCLLWDSPCRFSFSSIYALKRREIPVCLVNGWLYEEGPRSRLDRLEYSLFAKDYVRLFDQYLVQTDNVRQALLNEGAIADKVVVTGNIKFDAVGDSPVVFDKAKSGVLLQQIVQTGKPTIVAGCVTNLDEQTLILDAFVEVKRSVPDALLILAPRHPENKERMDTLERYFQERHLRYEFLSRSSTVDVRDIDVLALDMMGELKDFYAAGTVSYVGLNHNVLEPLAFSKPVVVTPGWNRKYPSYPVYRLLRDQGVLLEVTECAQLSNVFIALLTDKDGYHKQQADIEASLQAQQGAVEVAMEKLRPFLGI